MELNQNTKAFLSKLAHKYNCTEDVALKILVEEVHGHLVATLEQGKVTI